MQARGFLVSGLSESAQTAENFGIKVNFQSIAQVRPGVSGAEIGRLRLKLWTLGNFRQIFFPLVQTPYV